MKRFDSRLTLLGFWLLVLLFSVAPSAQAHNLDQTDTSIAFDKATLDMMAARAGLNQSLIQAGDSIGLILKSTPGPQSGYQWAFNRDYYLDNPGDPNRMKNAVVTGPWKRIQFPGSTIAKDQVGLKSAVLGCATADASSLGTAVSPGTPLPVTLNWTDATSPKAVRLSYGGLVLGQSEYARVQLKILADPSQPNSPFDANGGFFTNTDTFVRGRRPAVETQI